MKGFLEEFIDEFTDFWEDLWEHTTKKHPKHQIQTKDAVINGVLVNVRPAYIFC